MAVTRSYLAGNRTTRIPLLTASLASSGYENPVISSGINVSELGRAAPDLLVLDVDDLDIDPIELLRRTRFVLPNCIIAVYSDLRRSHWARSCHLAGANCMLSKHSDAAQLVAGLRQALSSGCYTDPVFAERLPT
jgi:DNA-binding NarL/FixJ family response regulator